jgi:hypothetical protein
MRIIYLFFIIIIFIGCSSEENEVNLIDTPQTEQGNGEESEGESSEPEEGEEGSEGEGENGEVNEDFTYFQLTDNNHLDFSRINILSEEKNSQVNPDGSFEDLSESNHIKFNLVLYDNEAILAYYPSLIVSNKIDIANFLVFYFANIPLISIYDLNKEDLYELIKSNSHNSQLYNEFQTSLNNGKNPLENSAFVEVFKKAVISMVSQIDSNSQNRGHIGDFSLTYYRNGEITIPSISPIDAVLGVEFSGDFGSLLQDGVHLVKPKLPLGLENFLKKINYSGLIPDSNLRNITLINGGTYNIRISNAKIVNSPIDATVSSYNKILLSAYNLYFAAKFMTDIDELAQLEDDLEELINSQGDILYNSELEPSLENYKESFDITLSKIRDILESKLSLNSSFLSQITRLLGNLISTLSDVQNFGEWLVVDATIRTYTNHYENQYFNFENPFALHGKLEYQNLTDLNFEVSSNETVNFTIKVKEKEIGYDVAIQGWGKTLNAVEKWQPAFQIPFTYSVLEGDATVNLENPLFTDNDGKISLNILAGNQDSRIKITPLIGNSDIPEQIIQIENIDLPKPFWKGSMSLTNSEDLKPCQVDRNNDGNLDYDVDCGTGGCQSCTRALFGSSYRTSATIEFAYSDVITDNNFKVGATVGGNTTGYVVYCYTSNIKASDDEFTVSINHYAPRGLNSAGSKLQEVTFKITERTSNSIKGTWSGKIRVDEDHCLEACSGVWEVSPMEMFESECDRIPVNP